MPTSAMTIKRQPVPINNPSNPRSLIAQGVRSISGLTFIDDLDLPSRRATPQPTSNPPSRHASTITIQKQPVPSSTPSHSRSLITQGFRSISGLTFIDDLDLPSRRATPQPPSSPLSCHGSTISLTPSSIYDYDYDYSYSYAASGITPTPTSNQHTRTNKIHGAPSQHCSSVKSTITGLTAGPGRVHHYLDNVTDYCLPGVHGWEFAQKARLAIWEARIGEVDEGWARNGGGVIRDLRKGWKAVETEVKGKGGEGGKGGVEKRIQQERVDEEIRDGGSRGGEKKYGNSGWETCNSRDGKGTRKSERIVSELQSRPERFAATR